MCKIIKDAAWIWKNGEFVPWAEATLHVLARWLPQARARGFAIVPVSAVVRQRLGIGRQYVETTG